ncbi:MAG: hypothetical protein AAGC53_23660 [Actinomycetota bacterium]
MSEVLAAALCHAGEMVIRVERWVDFETGEQMPAPWVWDESGRVELPREYKDAIRFTGRRISGSDHQRFDDGVPVFSDGTALSDGWRGWGRLMAEIWSDVDGVAYDYIDFYSSIPDERT